MALYELTFEVPEAAWDDETLTEAVLASGFNDPVVGTGRRGFLGVIVEHENPAFSTGDIIAAAILPHLPEGSKLHSFRQSVSVYELSAEEIERIANSMVCPR